MCYARVSLCSLAPLLSVANPTELVVPVGTTVVVVRDGSDGPVDGRPPCSDHGRLLSFVDGVVAVLLLLATVLSSRSELSGPEVA